jgi:hypothetical protein
MNDDKFVGTPDGISFSLTESEKKEAIERQNQFKAELQNELKGIANPTEREKLAAIRRIGKRWRAQQ